MICFYSKSIMTETTPKRRSRAALNKAARLKEQTNVIHAQEPLTQAEAVFQKFGGPTRLYLALRELGRIYNRSSLYKWAYPRSKGGTGGWVPTSAWADVLAAARLEGVFITSDEMDPRYYLPKKAFK
jgi:hypothetical protein